MSLVGGIGPYVASPLRGGLRGEVRGEVVCMGRNEALALGTGHCSRGTTSHATTWLIAHLSL